MNVKVYLYTETYILNVHVSIYSHQRSSSVIAMNRCPTRTRRPAPMRALSRSRPLAPPPCTSSPCPTMYSGTCTRTCRSTCRETGSASQVKFPALLSREEGCVMLMLAKLRMSRVNTNMHAQRLVFFICNFMGFFFHIITSNSLFVSLHGCKGKLIVAWIFEVIYSSKLCLFKSYAIVRSSL